MSMPSRLSMCCLRPLLNPDGDDEFYVALGVPRDASEKLIKKQYRKLSLSLHPDKMAQRGRTSTEAEREQFLSMKEAYDCLGNKRKRRLYDSLGSLGLMIYDNPTSVDSNVVAKKVAKTCSRCSCFIRCFVLSFVFLFVGFFVVFFPLLLSLNADHKTDIRWAAVWAPLWCIDAFVLLNYIAWVAEVAMQKCCGRSSDRGSEDAGGGPPASEGGEPPAGEGEGDDDGAHEESKGAHDETPLLARFGALVHVALLIIFQVLVVVRLDSKGDSPQWIEVFIPLWAWESSVLLGSMVGACSSVALPEAPSAAAAEAGHAAAEARARAVFYAQQLEARESAWRDCRTSCLRLAFEALVAVSLAKRKGDDTSLPLISWWVVFLPIWVHCFTLYLQSVKDQIAANEMTASLARAPDDAAAKQAELKAASLALRGNAKNLSCSLISLFGSLTVLRIYEKPYFSTLVIFIPVFIFAGCCLCCTCVAVCSFRGDFDVDDPADARPPKHAANAPPVTAAPQLGQPPSAASRAKHSENDKSDKEESEDDAARLKKSANSTSP
ncbi:hypothetical protein M885DRAFT_162537 [Pelagophyceae sp. CCMP2097]|nr:hypothetical protein M885DRAFT_162537 [Pelagophyceae sp. CCMP2097]